MLTGDHAEAIQVINQRIEEATTMRNLVAATYVQNGNNKERTYTLWELDTRIQRLEDSKHSLTALAEWGNKHRKYALK